MTGIESIPGAEVVSSSQNAASRWELKDHAQITRVALVGPDGVGKSTVIRLVRERLRQELPWLQIELRQWRPALLPNLGEIGRTRPPRPASEKPRRDPGRLHLVRVAYYLVDYLLGAHWEQRRHRGRAVLFLYDRCALDMQVDPVRFALRSKLGTRFLWRITKKPQAVVLLEDDPHRILARKQELAAHEMAEQQAEWRRLATRGAVTAAVRVDGAPEEIAARVHQVVLDTLAAPAEDDAARRCDVVFWLRDVLERAGGGEEREFVCLPSMTDPRVLTTATTGRAAASALDGYNPQRFVARAAHAALRSGLRFGIARPWLRRRRAALPIGEVEQHLRRVTGCPTASVCISPGTPGPLRKIVLQVVDADGRAVAWAKLGASEATDALIENEARALRSLGHREFQSARTPQVLDAGRLGDSFILVQNASGPLKRSGLKPDDRHLQFLLELAAVPPHQGTVSRATDLSDCSPELDAAGFPYYAHLADRAVSVAGPLLRDILPVFVHGDFAPWNIRQVNGKLLVYDWELAGAGLPATDLFHFLVSVMVELNHASGAEVFAKLTGSSRRTVAEYISRAGYAEGLFLPLLIGYAARALKRHAVLHGPASPQIERAWQRVLSTILLLGVNRLEAELER